MMGFNERITTGGVLLDVLKKADEFMATMF